MSRPTLLEQRLHPSMVAAPMFLVSDPQRAPACCRNGIRVSGAALSQRPSSACKAWQAEIEAGLQATSAPYAVKPTVHGSNPRLPTDLALCIEQRAPIVISRLAVGRT